MDEEQDIKFHELEQLLRSKGWEVLNNFLTEQITADMVALASVKREFPDDYYRGRVSTIRWLQISLPEQVREYFEKAKVPVSQPPEDRGHPYGPDSDEDNPQSLGD